MSVVSELSQNLQGRVVDGKFPLLRCLGESDHSVVFLTERKSEPQKAAIKLIPAGNHSAAGQISRWESAAKLSHPHLQRLYEMGHCQFGSQAYLYIVMEYADENLYQILPERPLTSEEVRAMLPAVVGALRYLRNQGFVHAHIRPTNILACGEQLKISSDGVTVADAARPAPPSPSLYDPPEAKTGVVSPAWDAWSLGVTLVEALTQHPPSRRTTEGNPELLPQSLPVPFPDIVKHCLSPRPEQRWSLDEIAASLNSADAKPAHPPTAPIADQPVSQSAAEATEQPAFTHPARFIAISVVVLMILAIVVVRLWREHSGAQELAVPPPVPVVSPAPAANLPSQPAQAANPGPSANASPAPPANNAGAAEAPGAVAQQVLPTVPHSASNTIHGIIKVKAKVSVDASGNVSSSNLTLRGSSAYFARLALDASRQWKFVPPRRHGENIASTWNIEFEFRRGGTRAVAAAL